MVRGAGSADAEAGESGWVAEGGLSAADLEALDAVGGGLGTVERPRGLVALVLAALMR